MHKSAPLKIKGRIKIHSSDEQRASAKKIVVKSNAKKKIMIKSSSKEHENAKKKIIIKSATESKIKKKIIVKSSEPKESKKIIIKKEPNEHIEAPKKPKFKSLQYTSIDIGAKNYSMCIQRRYENKSTKYPRILYWDNFGLFSKEQKVRVTQNSLKKLTEYLDSLKDVIEKSDFVLVEAQVRKNSKGIIKIEQHTHTYLQLRYPNIKVIEIPSKWKFTYLGAEGKMTPYRRKKWSVQRCIEFLEERDQQNELEFLNDHNKKDDLAESHNQIEAFVINRGYY